MNKTADTTNKSTLTIVKYIASWGGTGFLPYMPGTWGSIAAFIMVYAIIWFTSQSCSLGKVSVILTVLSVLVTMVGTWACQVIFDHKEQVSALLPKQACDSVGKEKSHFDPSWIVVDEVAGYCLAVAIVAMFKPLTPLLLISALLIFRVLDIQKPWPIRTLEKSMGENTKLAPLGVMADDLVAGIITALVVIFLIAA